jgi:hypothetical protein
MIMKKTRLLIITLIIALFAVVSQNAESQCSGTSMHFDGTDDFLYSPFHDYEFHDFTLECWINVPTYDDNVHYISLYQNAYLIIGDWYAANSILTWAGGLDPVSIESSYFDSTDTWYHVAFVYDGINQAIYVNGEQDTIVQSTGEVVNDTSYFHEGLVIGARYEKNTQFVEGKIDEVRIWNIARTQTEIQNSMNSLLAGNETGLVAYYQFEDGPGSDTVTDITGNENTLTLNNMDINNDWINDSPVDLIYNFSETFTVCSGDSCVFPDGTTQDNITSQVIHVSNLMTVYGCDSTITTTVNVNPAYDLNETVSVCSGDSCVFPDGTTQDSITGQVIHVSNFITVNGCDSIITTTVNVHSVDISVSVDGPALTANASGAAYQWIDCNDGNSIIEGETGQSFVAVASGDYAVIITDNSCTDTSDCYNVTITDMEDHDFDSQIIVYPNPANSCINIENNGLFENITVELTNISNQRIIKRNINSSNLLSIDISGLSAGVYFIKICTKRNTIIKRFIKNY